ncbi:MAG: glycosyltransferase, partial [Vicinamibacterales bacterium]
VAVHPKAEASKFVTIHNGFDPEDLATPRAPTPQQFRIAFAGVWKQGYNPAPLYDAIEVIARTTPAILDGVEVIAAGFEAGEAQRRGLAAHITEVGVLSHADAVSLMHSADVLFLSNGDGARQQLGLPGKMYEYLATGRPVLALTNPAGDAGQIIREVGGGVAVPADDPDGLREVIAGACRNRRLDTPPQNRAALAAFERPNLTEALARLLERATNRMPSRAGSTRVAPAEPAALR